MGEFVGGKLIVLIFLTIITLITIITFVRVISDISYILGFRLSDIKSSELSSLINSAGLFRGNFNVNYELKSDNNVKYCIKKFSYLVCINSTYLTTTEDCFSIFSDDIKVDIIGECGNIEVKAWK